MFGINNLPFGCSGKATEDFRALKAYQGIGIASLIFQGISEFNDSDFFNMADRPSSSPPPTLPATSTAPSNAGSYLRWEFHAPEASVRKDIWCAMIPQLKDNDALKLASCYNFSGGQMKTSPERAKLGAYLQARRQISTPSAPSATRNVWQNRNKKSSDSEMSLDLYHFLLTLRVNYNHQDEQIFNRTTRMDYQKVIKQEIFS